MIGDEIRRRRRELGLTLNQVAERLGCSIAYISQIERGLKKPTDNNIEKLEIILMMKLFRIKEIDEMELKELKELARNELARRKAKENGVDFWTAVAISNPGDVFKEESNNYALNSIINVSGEIQLTLIGGLKESGTTSVTICNEAKYRLQ